jgi:hypothetical protein
MTIFGNGRTRLIGRYGRTGTTSPTTAPIRARFDADDAKNVTKVLIRLSRLPWSGSMMSGLKAVHAASTFSI